MRRIAEEGPRAFYEGDVAAAIAEASWLEESDLAAFEPRWVEPLRLSYKGTEVCEMPPPTQGVAALEALGLLERSSPSLASKISCVQLALEDAYARVRDGADVSELISPEYLDARRGRAAVTEPAGGTAYVAAVDGDRTAVSLIQSLYGPFGSGVVAPGTGVVLNNRTWGFDVNGAVEPGRRPYHTIIPGMLFRDGNLLGPFGIVGGPIQAQAHMQFVSASWTTASTRRLRSTGHGSVWTESRSCSRKGCGTMRPTCASSATTRSATPSCPASARARRCWSRETSWSADRTRARTATPPGSDRPDQS